MTDQPTDTTTTPADGEAERERPRSRSRRRTTTTSEPVAEAEERGGSADAAAADAGGRAADTVAAEDDAGTDATAEDGSPEDEATAEARPRRRARRRTRATSAGATETTDTDTAPAETVGADDADDDAAADDAETADIADEEQAGDAGSTPIEEAAAQDDVEASAEGGEPADDDEEQAAGDQGADAKTGGSRSSRRRRGRRSRRRGRGGGGRSTAEDAESADAADAEGADDEEPATEDERAAASADAAPAPTRLQARANRSRARGRGRSSTGSRRPVGAVSDETRRAINESPPRRMLVTVGQTRTQVAVLEQRTLVEHYVTRKEDISYVGNIYMGRVQNVLPGMEAAFVDIGKGRNGVLYAGEVNYDEADLEGDLPRIEQTLKSGQSVLVQVTKDPMGSKGARLTQQLSIAGRYCVLAPGDGMLGISRKLPDEERDRLRKILKDIRPESYGLIVRTAAEGATREQLEADVERLVRKWKGVEERAETAKALDPVYSEPDLVIRVIRDHFGPEYTDLIIDSAELAEQVREYLSDVSPDLVDRVSVHEPGEDGDRLFDAYEVTNQVRRALEKKVWLASGGYLIIEKTEAMWVIDVNTGKFVGKTNLEETVLKNNLEAADEIARQLRLRDMGGIIVIDFVDMLVPANRDEVLKRFKRELARDKTKSRVMEISKLGLVQMTRKNVSQGLTESFTTKCEHCEGRGAQILEDAFH